MKYLIVLLLAFALTACSDAVGSGTGDPADDPTLQTEPDPIQPADPPTKALKGLYIGQMTGSLLAKSTYKISIYLNETADGKFVAASNLNSGSNYYQLWDQKLGSFDRKLPDYDGYASGDRNGSVLNLILPLNYNPCYANFKAYVSTDTKTINFFPTKQTVKCSVATINIALKPFTLQLQ
jgi:hypothetical protein